MITARNGVTPTTKEEMMAKTEGRSCLNCHHNIVMDGSVDTPCIGKSGCYYQKGFPDWQPMTNADRLRRAPLRELAAQLIAYRNLGKHVTLQDVVDWLAKEAKD